MFSCFLFGALLPVVALASTPLGISGNQDSVCKSACLISDACRFQCPFSETRANGTLEFRRCECQDACLSFLGVCDSCCDATPAKYPETIQSNIFCNSAPTLRLFDCDFRQNKTPEASADVFGISQFTSGASFAPAQSSYVAALPSPESVSISVTTSDGVVSVVPPPSPLIEYATETTTVLLTTTATATATVTATVRGSAPSSKRPGNASPALVMMITGSLWQYLHDIC